MCCSASSSSTKCISAGTSMSPSASVRSVAEGSEKGEKPEELPQLSPATLPRWPLARAVAEVPSLPLSSLRPPRRGDGAVRLVGEYGPIAPVVAVSHGVPARAEGPAAGLPEAPAPATHDRPSPAQPMTEADSPSALSARGGANGDAGRPTSSYARRVRAATKVRPRGPAPLLAKIGDAGKSGQRPATGEPGEAGDSGGDMAMEEDAGDTGCPDTGLRRGMAVVVAAPRGPSSEVWCGCWWGCDAWWWWW